MGHLTKIANDLYQNMEKGKNHEKITGLYNGMFNFNVLALHFIVFVY